MKKNRVEYRVRVYVDYIVDDGPLDGSQEDYDELAKRAYRYANACMDNCSERLCTGFSKVSYPYDDGISCSPVTVHIYDKEGAVEKLEIDPAEMEA